MRRVLQPRKKMTFSRWVAMLCLLTLVMPFLAIKGAYAQEATINLYVGQSFEIKSYLMSETDIKLGSASWKSFNTEIVTVTDSGILKAKKVGETYVTATTTSGGVIRDVKIKVIVVSGVGALELNEDKLSLVMGQTAQLSGHLVAYNGMDKIYDQQIKWTSSNPRVLSVDDTGKVTAIGEGTAYIQATSSDGGKTARCEFVVKSMVKSIRFEGGDLTLKMGETKPVNVIFDPEDVPVKSVTYRTSNGKVADISASGVVTSKSVGSCMISATSTDGKQYTTAMVHVVSMLSGIKLDKSQLALDSVKNREQILATLIPKNEKELPLVSEITWTSSNTTVATVDKEGVVKAVGSGRATITATTTDGGFQARCEVTSTLKSSSSNGEVPAQMVTILNAPETAYLGQKVSVDFTVSPADATQRTASVTLDPPSSVSVFSEPGHFVFTPTKTGIMAVSVKVGNASARFVLKVKPSVENLSLVTPKLTGAEDERYVYLGQEVKVTAKFDLAAFKVADLDNRTLTWRYTSDYLQLRTDPEDPYSVYVKLIRPVSTPITATFFDGLVIKRLNLIYEPMAQSMVLADSAQINLNYAFKPEVTLKPKANLRYDYKEVIDPSCDIYLEEIYVSTEFIKNELAFELDNLPSLLKQAATKPTPSEKNAVMSEWEKHVARRNIYEKLITDGKEAYQQIKVPSELTDRNLNKVKLFELSNNTLTTAVNGKALVRVVSRDGHFEKKMWVYAKAQTEDLILMDAAGNILATSSDRAQKALEAKKQLEAMNALNALKDKFTGYGPNDLPSADQIGVVYQAIQNQLIGLNDFKGKFQKPVTKLDVLGVFVNAYEKVTNKKVKAISSNYFTDVNSQLAEKAYQLGLVSGNKERKLNPNQAVDATFIKEVSKRWLKATKKQVDDKVINGLISGSGSVSVEDFIVFIYKLTLQVK